MPQPIPEPSEDLYGRLLEAIPEALLLTDAQDLITAANARAERLFGYARGELRGRPTEQLVPERLRGDHHARRVQLLGDPRPEASAALARLGGLRRDGTEFPMDVSIARIPGAPGPLLCVAIRDATEHNDRAAELLRSESLKRAILESSLDCIVAMDDGGLVVEFNRAAEQTFGYRSDEAVGRPVAELLVPPRHRDAHLRGLARYLATGAARVIGKRFEIEAMRRDGTEFPAELAVAVIQTGAQPMFTAYIRDLTEQRRADAQYRRHTEELERFHGLAVGRELRMIELKREVNDLARRAGLPPPYDLSFLDDPQ